MNDEWVNRLELLLALVGLALLGGGHWLAQQNRSEKDRRARDRVLLALGLLGALAYTNFGFLHFGNFIHTWDTYHYYIGSKYFPELRYDRLYECTAIADAESGLRAVVEKRSFTDLRTNALVKARAILANPQECKQHFTLERWEDFKHDVGWFRSRVPRKWEMIQHDHGYNATPVWHLAGHALSNLSRASTAQVMLLTLLDPLYLLLMIGLIYWAFGWRTSALALLVFGTCFPSKFFWTGGAFLRHDWLFFLVACICWLKKGRPLLAGLAIAYATTLRIFPGLVLIGPLLAAIEIFRRERRLDRTYLRLFAGAALGVAVLLPASYALSGGWETYQRFAQNTAKHASTPLTNHMGLRTVLSYRPSTIGAVLRDPRAEDPWKSFREARLKSFAQVKPVFVLAVLGFLTLLYFAVKPAGTEPWVAAALSVTVIAVGAELTCYYYAFVIALALLQQKRSEVGLLLLAFTATTMFIGIAPFPNMSTWDDEKYVAMSVAALVAFSGVLWLFTAQGAKHGLGPEAPLPPKRQKKAARLTQRPS